MQAEVFAWLLAPFDLVRLIYYTRQQIHTKVNFAMYRTLRILQAFVFFFSSLTIWLAVAAQALAADAPPPKPAEGGATDYMLSYLVVILAIVLGLLVVARATNRRDRERPAGYVEKNIIADK